MEIAPIADIIEQTRKAGSFLEALIEQIVARDERIRELEAEARGCNAVRSAHPVGTATVPPREDK